MDETTVETEDDLPGALPDDAAEEEPLPEPIPDLPAEAPAEVDPEALLLAKVGDLADQGINQILNGRSASSVLPGIESKLNRILR